MNKPRIFPKSLKWRGQILKRVNLGTSQLYNLDIYVNHLKTYHTLLNKSQHAEITLFFVPTSIFTFSYTTAIQ